MRNGGPVYEDIDAYEEQYDPAGIDKAVLSQSQAMGGTDPAEVERAIETLFKAIESRERFYGLASLPTGAGGNAATEFERCLRLGFNGGAIETVSSGTAVHDSEFAPVFVVTNRWGSLDGPP